MRSASDRLAAIDSAVAARDAFLQRIAQADGMDIAALMAEAIDMHLAANSLERVGRDGRVSVSVEVICASHCLKAVRDAFARSTNRPASAVTP